MPGEQGVMGEAGRSDGIFQPGTLHVLLNETDVWAPEWPNLTHVMETLAWLPY